MLKEPPFVAVPCFPWSRALPFRNRFHGEGFKCSPSSVFCYLSSVLGALGVLARERIWLWPEAGLWGAPRRVLNINCSFPVFRCLLQRIQQLRREPRSLLLRTERWFPHTSTPRPQTCAQGRFRGVDATHVPAAGPASQSRRVPF